MCFTQRRVQIKSGQRVQGVQEFRYCQGTPAAEEGGLVMVVGRSVRGTGIFLE